MKTAKIKVFYSEDMISYSAYRISPSVTKPRFVAEALLKSGLPVEFQVPEPCSLLDLYQVHDRGYVDGVLSLEIRNGFGSCEKDVADSLVYTTGAMMDAAKYAIKNKTVAAALCSGFHHAFLDYGGGFCTFNGLVIAAMYLLDAELAKKIVIVDCDQHYGDGTQSLLGLHRLEAQVLHITFGEWFHSRRDAPAYLNRVNQLGDDFFKFKPDVILYQAGADSHRDDPLGVYFRRKKWQVGTPLYLN